MAFVPDPRIWLHVPKHRVCCISSVFQLTSTYYFDIEYIALCKYITYLVNILCSLSGFSQILFSTFILAGQDVSAEHRVLSYVHRIVSGGQSEHSDWVQGYSSFNLQFSISRDLHYQYGVGGSSYLESPECFRKGHLAFTLTRLPDTAKLIYLLPSRYGVVFESVI